MTCCAALGKGSVSRSDQMGWRIGLMRTVVFALALQVGLSAAAAQDAPLSWGHAVPVEQGDAERVRSLIERQLDAFRRNDPAEAYAATAPNIRRRFPTPEAFIAMAQAGYAPLFASIEARYPSVRSAAPTPTSARTWSQTATIVTRDGESWTATYGIEDQPDGSLGITSCVIVRNRSGAV